MRMHSKPCSTLNFRIDQQRCHLIRAGRTHQASRRLRTDCRAERRPDKVVVVGGGAAGLTAAYFAAKEKAQVLILEKTSEAGKKILISGGKRCNVLPMDIELDKDYFTESSQSAARAIFAQWTLLDCKTWLEDELGLHLSCEEGSSKYFPASNSAQEVRDRLLSVCLSQGASIQYKAELIGLTQQDGMWICKLADQSFVQSNRVIIASGGLSFPAMGTDGRGMELLKDLGHNLSKPYPALTPLRGPHVASKQLAGLSLYNARMWCEASKIGRKSKRKQLGKAERSAMLFTHRGFSGPAVLDLSHHLIKAWQREQDTPGLHINWLDQEAVFWEDRLSTSGSKTVVSVLKQGGLPSRLAEALTEELSCMTTATALLKDRRAADLTKAEKASLLQKLVSYTLDCSGHEGYPKMTSAAIKKSPVEGTEKVKVQAEVTGGGVKLSNIDCSTMESRVSPGLFLCGEVLDMFGRIGGFNFYWAWLTGRQAGLGAARS